MANRIGHKPPARTPPTTIGGGVIRPMYGIAIRDDLFKFRNEIGKTIDDTQKAINAGDPKAPVVFGDGKLEGSEVTKAKKALHHLQLAQKQLKPVFGGPFGP